MKKYYIIGQDFDDGMRWDFIKDYTNEEQPVSHFDYTEDKDEAQYFETEDEARTVLEEVFNYQNVCVSDGGNDFAPVETWKVAYYDKNSGAFYDGETDKYMFDYDGYEPEPGDLEESISILKKHGYRVVLNESEHYCIQCGREIHGRPAETLDSLEFCSQHCYFDYLEDVNNPDEPDYEDHLD